MKRWFAARMGEWEGEGYGIVPKTNMHECNSRIWSVPGREWCVGQLAARNLGSLQSDPDIILFPDALLDLEWRTVGNGIRSKLITSMQAAGFDASGVLQGSTFRDVLHLFVHQLQPGVSIEQGDVVDME